MYIEPKTNIRLLSGVPLDTTYEHSLSWADESSQREYFVSKTKYNLTDYNYVRVSNGIARVGINAENLYDCNYMMFQNTAFGSKWFYAFVTEIVYLNNGASEIHFTIDDLQTWYFQFTIDKCFIERETTSSDEIGEHIEAEPVATGEMVSNGFNIMYDLSTQCAIATITTSAPSETYDPETWINQGLMYDGVYSGTFLEAFPLDEGDKDMIWINKRLGKYLKNPDQVVNLYMCPVDFLPMRLNHEEYNPIASGEYGRSIEVLPPIGSSVTKGVTKLDDYTPNNAKLYTYPYNYFGAYGGSSSLILRYEFFKKLSVRFRMLSTITYPVQATLYPKGYKGVASESIYKMENLQINEFPMCSWQVDAYKAYVAQNAIPNAVSAISGGLTAGTQLLSGNAIGSFNTSVGEVANIITREYKASIASDISKGNFTNGNVDNAQGLNTFFGGQMSVTHQQAKIIDDFFTKYGYAVNIVKEPEIRSRPHFNYIKTVSCTATGNIPSDSMKNICRIFDNGITFWKNASEVGNYSVDNRV